MTVTTSAHGTAGLLVLGMHRSGTSALSRILQLGGADIGGRLVAGSAGNEAGHWEDAFAVESHERLLAAFGTRWDEPFGLPPGWADSEVAADAQARIASYLDGDRRAHRPWSAKDPRLSLFASLWLRAADQVGMQVGTVHLVRHPAEVAASLEARDALGHGTGLLLWFDYTLSALLDSVDASAVHLTYPQLLGDWRACMARVQRGCAIDGLTFGKDAAAEVDAFLSQGMRHHDALASHTRLPPQVDALWRYLLARTEDQPADADALQELRSSRDGLAALLSPYVRDVRAERRSLWERTGRAEAAAVRLAAAPDAIELHFSELRERADLQQQALVAGISSLASDLMGAGAASAEFDELRARMDHQVRQMEYSLAELRERGDRQSASIIEAVSASIRDSRRAAEAAVALRDASDAHASAILDAVDRTQALQVERDTLARTAAELKVRVAAQEGELARLVARIDEQHIQLLATLRDLDASSQQAATLDLILRSSSWRLTRPLRVLRRLLSPMQGATEWGRLGRAASRRLSAFPLLPPTARERYARSSAEPPGPAVHRPLQAELPVELVPQREGVADVFVWSVIDWNFRTQRPQHLARALAARGHRVFYVSNNFADDQAPGFALEPLDASGRLFQVHLNLHQAAGIYYGMPDDATLAAMRRSLGSLQAWTQGVSAISIVQHPYWERMATSVHNARLVYDCMDHHGGFEDNAADVIEAEERLIAHADLLVVTSNWLASELGHKARNVTTIRNATDYGYFSTVPDDRHRDPNGRAVIGYYGAVAEWFDVDLVRRVARAHPQAQVVIVGADTAGAASRLAGESNIAFVGEVPYAKLGYWLHGFDACILPFKVIPLTLATNPVKVYEYLSAGKPVVSVDLPELAEFGGTVSIAADADAFVQAVGDAIAAPPRQDAIESRRRFASLQTWGHRASALADAMAAIEEPRVSVIVLAYNNLAFTQACLFSVEAYSDYRNLELIVVDNASSDGSREWLSEWGAGQSAAGSTRRVILNDANLGFSAGNNVGLRAATGEFLILLNNDTYVTPGWLRTLCWHLRREPGLGLVGPVTNNIGNEARIDIGYPDMTAMIKQAAGYTRAHAGQAIDIAAAAFFCVAMRREVYEAVGPMDEDFGVGFFEDDDYCNRVRALGLGVACAEDVFVHHHLSASFDQLKADAKQALFEKNKMVYEAKWGTWRPHAYRKAGDT